MDKRIIAEKHYDGLMSLSNQKMRKFIEDELVSKENFIENYPLSSLGIVSVKKFWEVCLELNIVTKPFYEDEKLYNDFEKKLHDLCEQYMFSDEEDFSLSEFKEKIQLLFKENNL